MAGLHRPRRVQLAGLLPDPDAHAFANRIHQRALYAPRFFGAGPLTWSSGPSTPFPSDHVTTPVASRHPTQPRRFPRFTAPGSHRVRNVPRFTGRSLPGRRVPRFTGPGPTGSSPGPECPTFTGRAPPTPFGLYKVTKDRGEGRSCVRHLPAGTWKGAEQVWVAL